MNMFFGTLGYFLKIIHIEKDNLVFRKNQLNFLPLSTLLNLLNNIISLGRFNVLSQNNRITFHLTIYNSVAIDHSLDLTHDNCIGYLGWQSHFFQPIFIGQSGTFDKLSDNNMIVGIFFVVVWNVETAIGFVHQWLHFFNILYLLFEIYFILCYFLGFSDGFIVSIEFLHTWWVFISNIIFQIC